MHRYLAVKQFFSVFLLIAKTQFLYVENQQDTLVYLIIVQDGINVQDGKIPKINKRAGWNKAVQVGIFQKLLL